MKTTRHKIFETNSSSTHSISISKSNILLTSIKPDKDGNIILYGGKFGWKVEKYNSPLVKANYCALDCDGDKEKTSILIKVIMDHTGAKGVVLDLDGYIDHQSNGTSDKAFENELTLKNFIFNPDSVLYTDNDNH